MNLEKLIRCIYNYFSLVGSSIQTHVVLSFDIERDWFGKGKYSETPSFGMIRSVLPKLLEINQSYNVASTLFVTGEAATSCSQILGCFLDNGDEIGTHTHPCFHPEQFSGSSVNDRLKDQLKEYSMNQQEAMIRIDTDRIGEALDIIPMSFRAGKLSVGSSTLEILSKLGYRFDSSFDASRIQSYVNKQLGIVFDYELDLFEVPVSLWIDPPDLAGISGRLSFIKAFLYRRYREKRKRYLLVVGMHPMIFSSSQEKHLLKQYGWMLEYLANNGSQFITVSQTESLIT